MKPVASYWVKKLNDMLNYTWSVLEEFVREYDLGISQIFILVLSCTSGYNFKI